MTHRRFHRLSAAVAPATSGFTLVELLAASAIGLLMTLAGLTIYITNLQATTAVLRGQNLRDNWSRVNLFINADIAEACLAANSGGSLVLTLDNTPGDACGTGSVTVTYSLADGILTRTGPPILATGAVDGAGAAAPQNLIEGVTVFNPACTTALRACYTLTLTQGGSTYTGNGGAAIEGRARVRQYS
jgi:prepilin-type N-terminal cleavage/methylation domain-containing protein